MRDRIRGLESNRHKVGTLLDLAGWLNRRRAFHRAIEAATAGLELVSKETTVDRANLLHVLAFAYRNTGHLSEALERYELSLRIRREIGDRAGEAATRWNKGLLYEQVGNFDRAVDELRASVALQAELKHPDLEKDRAHLAKLEARLDAERGLASEVAEPAPPYRTDAD